MKINNKFNLGDEVFYPAADLRSSRLLKAAVTGIVVTLDDDGKESIIYQTGQSYAVAEHDMFKTAGPAKRRLIKLLSEKKDEVNEDIKKAIKKIKEMKPSEITLDLTAQYEESTGEEDTPEVSEDDNPSSPV